MTTAPGTKPVLILMADDDPEDCLLTKKTLQKARLANELRFVQDGQELLDYLGRSGKFADPASSPLRSVSWRRWRRPRRGRRVSSSGAGSRIRSCAAVCWPKRLGA